MFRNLSVKNRLVLIILSVTAVAVTVSGGVSTIDAVRWVRADLKSNAQVNARLVGEYLITPLAFQYQEEAEAILEKLEAVPLISNAVVYDDEDNVFATYSRMETTAVLPSSAVREESSEFDGGYLHVFHAVMYQNWRYGTLYLKISTAPVGEKVRSHLLLVSLLVTGVLACSYFLALRLQYAISEPLVRLADVSTQMAGLRDSRVATQTSGIHLSQVRDDEIGVVYEGFQDMLERIKRQNVDLQKERASLARRVEERTADLNAANAELAIAKERAEAADRLKSAFLAAVSHELRTPLNSIIGFTGITLQGLAGPLNDEQAKQLGMVQKSARHLLNLINDILDISKIEAGEVKITPEPFDVRESIEKMMETMTPLAEEKGLALVTELAPEVGQITSDQRRVEQILINLVNNAVKFTDKGEARVHSEISDGWLVTRVTDTGIGIKPEDMGKLFQVFHQIDSGLTRRHEGTGLGLSICKKLVELLGGEIRAESEFGAGSTFTFTLPIHGRL